MKNIKSQLKMRNIPDDCKQSLEIFFEALHDF